MSFCPSCGKELSAEESNAKFCAYCGKPLAAEEPVVEEPVVEETPVAEEAVSEEVPVAEEAAAEQPTPEKKPNINIDVEAIKTKLIELKDKASEFCDKVIEKAKTVPAIAGVLEKIDSKFYPAVVAAPIALVILLLVVIIGISSSGSYMTPINEYLNTVNRKETNTMKVIYSLTPDYREGLLKKVVACASKSDDFKDELKDRDESFEDIYDNIDDEFKKWKITFKEKSHKKLDKDDIKDLQDALDDVYDDLYEKGVDEFEEVLDDDDDLEDFADKLDISENEAKALLKAMVKYYKSFEKMKVTEAYEVKGRFTIKADKEEWESNTIKIYVVKVNGSWTLAGISESVTFDDDDEEIALFRSFFSKLKTNYVKTDVFSSIY